jgi:hypothetical protein
MPDNSQQIVQKLWNYYNVLRDGGVGFVDEVDGVDPASPFAKRLLPSLKLRRAGEKNWIPALGSE